MKIKVKNLVANPYRNIEAYPINRAKIEQLRNSIRETTFWDNLLVRPVPGNGQYQIAYGHHRLIAIKEELGEDAVVDIPVRDLSDKDMLRIMANENISEWSTNWRVIIETVKQTKDFLQKLTPNKSIKSREISTFLGQNWNKGMVYRALAFLHDEDIMKVFSKKDEKIESRILDKIVSIKDKKAKRQWLKITKEKDLSYVEMQEIAQFENEFTLSNPDKEIIRKNILEGRIRGKEQIREQVEFVKVRKLQEAKKDDKDKRREDLRDFIEKTNGLTVGLSNKLEVLAEQFKQYPETKKFLPRVETKKFTSSLITLLLTIERLIKTTRGMKEKKRKELKNAKI